MKVDEPFNPNSVAVELPAGILCRPARQSDRDTIARLMGLRNPATPFEATLNQTEKELTTAQTDQSYRLLVAELEARVVGVSRFYRSQGLPAHKKTYPAPEGWYAMGTLVDPEFRRKGIARFLSEKRIAALRDLGVSEFYSMVDGTNLTSLEMHRDFGYEQIASAPGFLHMKFESGEGHLFRFRLW